jgi:hypothetical protein
MTLRHVVNNQGETIDPAQPPPGAVLWPTRKTLEEWLRDEPWKHYDSIAVDIESAGDYITIIGFTLYETRSSTLGPTLVLPFKRRLGLDYWDEEDDHLRASELAYLLLASDTRKVFHNGITFDIPMLTAAGFTVGGSAHDTMVRAHYCYPEMKKGLQYLSTAYLGMPNWKGMLDERDDNEGKS